RLEPEDHPRRAFDRSGAVGRRRSRCLHRAAVGQRTAYDYPRWRSAGHASFSVGRRHRRRAARALDGSCAARSFGAQTMTDRLRVRLYNVRFGDAILVTVPDRDPATNVVTKRHILIDVGNVLNKEGGDDTVFKPV